MIIISVGAHKSASTLIFDYQIDLVECTSRRNGQLILQKYSNGKGFRGKLDLKTFLLLLFINLVYGDIVLKTHSGPTFFVKALVYLNLAKVTYSYRDPRDTTLSILDHGKKTREEFTPEQQTLNPNRLFANVKSLEQAISIVKNDVDNWSKWNKFKNEFHEVFFVKYEDFLSKKSVSIKEMSVYLGLSIDDNSLYEIVEKYNNENSRNFNKGIIGRYKTEFSEEEIEILNKTFSDELLGMSYSLE